MTRLVQTKTSFTAGELDPRLLGRLDLRAQEDGAALLENVVVQPTGGVTRRPGTRFVANAPGATRLVGFDAPDGGALVAFGEFTVRIVQADGTVLPTIGAPWTGTQARALSVIRRGNALLICHPEIQPRRLIREEATSWKLEPWDWAKESSTIGDDYTRQPYARYVSGSVPIQARATGIAEENPIPAGSTVTVTVLTSDAVFNAFHYGSIIRIRQREIRIDNVVSATEVRGLVLQELVNGAATRDWDEAAFSQARGWPACCAIYQSRLVLGGARDMQDGLWLSKSSRILNFDTGTGLDDEAISFRLGGDRLHAVRALVVGRHLQIFTSAGEWIVADDTATPSSIRARQQTAIGSDTASRVQPIDVDGATLFVPSGGEGLREFLYTETEQAYQASDIALLARHLVTGPIDLAFDARRRRLVMVMADGTAAMATIDRNTDVVAWARMTTAGSMRAVALHGGALHLVVERGGTVAIERLDEDLEVDRAVVQSSATAKTAWTGLAGLDGREVWLIGDGTVLGKVTVTGGAVTTPVAVRSLVAGLPFTHRIEPSRHMAPESAGGTVGGLFRPVRVALRLLTTAAARLDTGYGSTILPLPESPFTGDVEVRLSGWRRGIATALWRIAQDDPVPFTLLSATHEMKVSN